MGKKKTYQKGWLDSYQDGTQGMMKAKIALENEFGNNPAIKRMIVAPDKPYVFKGDEEVYGRKVNVPQGETGTHFSTNIGNRFVPIIQEGNNRRLEFNSNPSYNDPEAVQFNTPEEADYFARHYKEVAPAFRKYQDGTWSIGGLIDDTVDYFGNLFGFNEQTPPSPPPENQIRKINPETEKKLQAIREGRMLHPKYKFYSDEELFEAEDNLYREEARLHNKLVEEKRKTKENALIQQKLIDDKANERGLEYLESKEADDDFKKLSKVKVDAALKRIDIDVYGDTRKKIESTLRKEDLMKDLRQSKGSVKSLEEAKDWTLDYLNSPMYRKRLERENQLPDNEIDIDSEIAQRKKNVETLKVNTPQSNPGAYAFYSNPYGITDQYGHDVQYTPGSYRPKSYSFYEEHGKELEATKAGTAGNRKFLDLDDVHNTGTSIHEVSHGSTRGDRDLSEGVIDKIGEFRKENKGEEKYNPNYFYQPTEVKARIDAARMLLRDYNIRDTFKEDIKMEDIEKLKQVIPVEDNQPLFELLEYFKPEQIKWMMNNIAKADTPMSSDQPLIAKNGLDMYKDGVSELGYSDGSPYRNAPYLDIHTPSGVIDMSNTGIALRANGRLLPPYSGKHQFDTDVVRERPAYQDGTDEVLYVDSPEDKRYQAYQDSLNLYNYYKLQDKIEPKIPDYISSLNDEQYKEYQDKYNKKEWKKGLTKLQKDPRYIQANLNLIKDTDKELIKKGNEIIRKSEGRIKYINPYASPDLDHITNNPISFYDGGGVNAVWKKPERPVQLKPENDFQETSFNHFASKFVPPPPTMQEMYPEKYADVPLAQRRETKLEGEPVEIRGGEPREEDEPQKTRFANIKSGEAQEEGTYWEAVPGKRGKYRLVKGSELEADYGYQSTPEERRYLERKREEERSNDDTALVYQDGSKRIGIPYSGEADEEGNLPWYVEGSAERPTEIEAVEARTEAPEWLELQRKYEKEYEEKYPFNPTGRNFVLRGSPESEKVRWNRLKDEYAREKAGTDLMKANPREDQERGAWLNQFTPEEQDRVLTNPMASESLWAQTKRGIKSNPAAWLYPTTWVGGSTGLLDDDPDEFSEYEKAVRKRSLEEHPLMTRALDIPGTLAYGQVPGRVAQSMYKEGFTLGDALKGKPSGAPIYEELLTDLAAGGIIDIGAEGIAAIARSAAKNKAVRNALLNFNPLTDSLDDIRKLAKQDFAARQKYGHIAERNELHRRNNEIVPIVKDQFESAIRNKPLKEVKEEAAKRIVGRKYKKEFSIPKQSQITKGLGEGYTGKVYEASNPDFAIKHIPEKDPFVTDWDYLVKQSEDLPSHIAKARRYSKGTPTGMARSPYKDNLLVMDKLPPIGKDVPFDDIPQKAWDKFVDDAVMLENKGLTIDMINPGNLKYNPETETINIFDIGHKMHGWPGPQYEHLFKYSKKYLQEAERAEKAIWRTRIINKAEKIAKSKAKGGGNPKKLAKGTQSIYSGWLDEL